MSENRRIATRHPVSIPVTVTLDGSSTACILTNLSLGGGFLQHPRVAMGSRLHLVFQVPGHETPIETQSTVRWSTSEGIGVQFDGLRARDVWALNRFFEQLRSSR